jgi:serine/threonine protein kinase
MSSKPRDREKGEKGEKREKKSRDRKPKEPSLFADPDNYDSTVPPSLDQMVLVVHVPGAFAKSYTRGRQLGQGAFAHVFAGTHLTSRSNKEYAVKKIDRSKMVWGEHDILEDEINNLTIVREGPNIVQLYEVYEERDYIFLIMELMNGGELFDRILDKRTFTEREARECCRCLLKGLDYMHDNRVAHRDLKPENLLLAAGSDTGVKLADFGFAKKVMGQNGCRTLCGTPGYLAPEILERWPAYDTICDMWSVGVILFLLLGGYLPFEDEDEDKVFERTRNGQYEFHPTYWKKVSTGAKDLVTKLLTVNPKKRYSAKESLDHEWIMLQDTTEIDQNELNIDKLKASVNAGKKMMKADAHGDPTADRMKELNDNFAGYLERQVDPGTRIKQDGAPPRKPVRRFEEDSKTGKKFDEFYDVGDMLGEGGYASVFRCVHKRTKDILAVKDIFTGDLQESSKSSLQDEIAALKLLRGGPHIIRLLDVFEEAQHTFMIMEECKGGDLLTRVTDKEVYTEREARKTCKILFEAMDYIHKKKIAHRDIKPENVLMVEAHDDTSIKIADFGFAKRVPKPNCLRTLCGTAQYVAPEVLDLESEGYDSRADMWSVGVVIYILLGGYAPFEGPVHELARVITKGDYEFHDKYWCDISDDATNMISNLLQIDPERRLSAEEALQCPWMIIEEETLTIKDLSGAQAVLQERQKFTEPGTNQVAALTNKFESLDFSFTQGLGTTEQVATRKAQRTQNPFGLGSVAESDVVEDSTSGKAFEILYQWGKLIGEGNMSAVHEARHKQSNEVYAVKRIKRNDLQTRDAVALQDEISCLQMASESPHVVTLYDVFDEPDFAYIVMERFSGGKLIDRIIEKKYYGEDDARAVATNLLLGLEHCHNRRIAVRNITTDNIMLSDPDDYTDVKICDFGFAKRVLYPNALSTQCGTEGYVAPEILEFRPEYDVQCDMWSLGVTIYMLLGGYRPFRGDQNEIARCIRYGEYKFHKRYWSTISEEAKILISRMLTVSPIGRITVTAAIESDWIQMESESEYSDQTDSDAESGRR